MEFNAGNDDSKDFKGLKVLVRTQGKWAGQSAQGTPTKLTIPKHKNAGEVDLKHVGSLTIFYRSMRTPDGQPVKSGQKNLYEAYFVPGSSGEMQRGLFPYDFVQGYDFLAPIDRTGSVVFDKTQIDERPETGTRLPEHLVKWNPAKGHTDVDIVAHDDFALKAWGMLDLAPEDETKGNADESDTEIEEDASDGKASEGKDAKELKAAQIKNEIRRLRVELASLLAASFSSSSEWMEILMRNFEPYLSNTDKFKGKHGSEVTEYIDYFSTLPAHHDLAKLYAAYKNERVFAPADDPAIKGRAPSKETGGRKKRQGYVVVVRYFDKKNNTPVVGVRSFDKKTHRRCISLYRYPYFNVPLHRHPFYKTFEECPVIDALRAQLNRQFCVQTNHGLPFGYINGTAGIGPHSDDQRDFDPNDGTIIDISFEGGEDPKDMRYLVFYEKLADGKPGKEVKRFAMRPGSVLVINKAANKYYLHALEPIEGAKGQAVKPREGLLFRHMASWLDTETGDIYDDDGHMKERNDRKDSAYNSRKRKRVSKDGKEDKEDDDHVETRVRKRRAKGKKTDG